MLQRFWLVDVYFRQTAEVWMTTGNEDKLLARDPDLVGQSNPVGGTPVVTVDRQSRQQAMKGFGAALSNAAAYLFYNSPQREQVCVRNTMFTIA